MRLILNDLVIVGTLFAGLFENLRSQELYSKDGWLGSLSRGYTYVSTPESSGTITISPKPNGFEGGVSATFTLTADSASDFLLRFDLPSSLMGDKGDSVLCSFTSRSLLWEEHSERWNPRSPHTIHLEAQERATLRLGMIAAIPNSVRFQNFGGTVTRQAINATCRMTAGEFAQTRKIVLVR